MVWRAQWRVCGMGPPSSGMLAVGQILGMWDAAVSATSPTAPATAPAMASVAGLHRYAEVARLAFADRAQYVADPGFVAAPTGRWESLWDPAYLRERAAAVGSRAAPGEVPAGHPGGVAMSWAPQAEQVEHGTSHVSVVDRWGQAVSFTTSVEAAFGSGLLVDGGTGLPGGFLLNNQLTDFSFLPQGADGLPVANRVQPGKRPRSSMSPTLVFRLPSGELEMVLGSPGGPAIIHYVARMLLATLGEGQGLQDAVNAPNFGNFNSPTVLEAGRFVPDTVQALEQLGHRVVQAELTSGLQVLRRQGEGWAAAADPRREGTAQGQ
jgi:gamma-glutamyltranspeptidase/glutathione hydrolase